jgi:putative NADPH-quinone reductase
MKKRNILIIVGHPGKESFSKSIGESYLKGAKSSGNKVKIIYLSEMNFNPNLKEGYKKIQPLEKDLLNFQKNILWAEHIVLITPVWWGSVPAKLKGLLDRAILPGFAFKYQKKSILPKRFLKGKSARVFMTKGGSRIFYFGSLAYPGMILRRFVFNFTGIFPVRVKSFYSMNNLSEERVQKILKKVFDIGKKGR